MIKKMMVTISMLLALGATSLVQGAEPGPVKKIVIGTCAHSLMNGRCAPTCHLDGYTCNDGRTHTPGN